MPGWVIDAGFLLLTWSETFKMRLQEHQIISYFPTWLRSGCDNSFKIYSMMGMKPLSSRAKVRHDLTLHSLHWMCALRYSTHVLVIAMTCHDIKTMD